jgi:hypothetical protein
VPTERFIAVYRVRADAASIGARALAIAVEQSVEMPLAAIDEPEVLSRRLAGMLASSSTWRSATPLFTAM